MNAPEIENVKLGRSGLSVSRLAIGGWQVSGWASSDTDTFAATLHHAIDRGINFIDTAEIYGKGLSEEIIGSVIEPIRDRIVLATKFSFQNSSPAKIRAALHSSLTRLRTDYIDLYQQHWPPPSPPLAETIDELERLKQEGKIKAIGVSNWMEPEWQEIGDPGRIESLQICYSLLWRNAEANVLPLCRAHEIGILAYSPLCQGLLAGRNDLLAETPPDSRRQNRWFRSDVRSQLTAFLELLRNIAHSYARPVSAVALRWILQHKEITAAIIGASNPRQVDENLLAFGWELSAADFNALSAASADFSKELTPHDSLWGFHPRERR